MKRAAHNTEETSNPAEEGEFFVEEERGEDSGDDDGECAERGLGCALAMWSGNLDFGHTTTRASTNAYATATVRLGWAKWK